jgi:hypothetical protein
VVALVTVVALMAVVTVVASGDSGDGGDGGDSGGIVAVTRNKSCQVNSHAWDAVTSHNPTLNTARVASDKRVCNIDILHVSIWRMSCCTTKVRMF